MKKSIIIAFLVVALVFASGCGKSEEKSEKQIENITREEKIDEKDIARNEPQGAAESETAQEATQGGEEENNEVASQSKEANLNEIRSEIKNAVAASDAMDLDADAISSFYYVDSADIKQAAGFVVAAGTFPHEAVMIEAVDSAAADRIEKLLKTKHEAFLTQSKGYDASNTALAQKCKVERYGNHISMFLTPDFEVMKTIYTKYVK